MQAMADLYRRLHDAGNHVPELAEGVSEAVIQNRVRLSFNSTGGILWRNNVGAAQDHTGRVFRYGLANDSKRMGEVIKSADLIGIKPVVITQDHVGRTIGQFTSREVKASNWSKVSGKREKAQAAWAALINKLGGDAQIVNSA